METKNLTYKDAINLFKKSKDGNLVIPNCFTEIDCYAFSDLKTLKSITIPDSVTYIGSYAFSECTSLTSITIPESVTYIGDKAFYKCHSLKSVNIPKGINRIGTGMFCDCHSLESISIPNNIKSIGRYAFAYCGSLKHIIIPNSVTLIDNYAFMYCASLDGIIINNGDVSIMNLVFYGCFNLIVKGAKKYDSQGRLIAYKGFSLEDGKLVCRDFEYEEGKTYTMDGKIEICERGFHACLNKLECFDYYCGKNGVEVEFHEVYLNNVIFTQDSTSTKVVASEITIGPKIDNFSLF